MLKLREIRRRAGMNQAELAARMGVSRSAIAMWESGGSQPDRKALKRVADGLYRRGFSWGVIQSALREYTNSLELEETP